MESHYLEVRYGPLEKFMKGREGVVRGILKLHEFVLLVVQFFHAGFFRRNLLYE